MKSYGTQAQDALIRCARLLASADPGVVDHARRQLASAVVQDLPAEQAIPLARALTSALDQAGGSQARTVLLLGILAEKAPDVGETAREGLGRYLQLLAAASCGSPVYLGLLYLLAHFPEDAQRIMAVAGTHTSSDPHGISRLERTLRTPDASDPETVNNAGRSWPSPALLAVTEEELAATAAERSARPAEQILASWQADTAALIAYSGGLAVAAGALCRPGPSPPAAFSASTRPSSPARNVGTG